MDKDRKEEEASELRRYAEKKLAGNLPLRQRSEADTKRLLHELQVHQIELEIQNEQLRQAQADLEASLTRFSDLYEFAPVGYLTLTAAGYVDENNHTAATMLGVEWAKLLRLRFDPFIAQEDIARWYQFFSALMMEVAGTRKSIELTLLTADDHNPIRVRMICVHVKTRESESKVRVAITETGKLG
ncbi:MAG: hypothetical protein WAO76_06530 [Georgfuchsia sp.]